MLFFSFLNVKYRKITLCGSRTMSTGCHRSRKLSTHFTDEKTELTDPVRFRSRSQALKPGAYSLRNKLLRPQWFNSCLWMPRAQLPMRKPGTIKAPGPEALSPIGLNNPALG